MGIYVSSDSIDEGVKVANGSLASFAYAMCDVVFMPEGAKYFSIAGSQRSKTVLETLALPSKYLTGYLCKSFVKKCCVNLYKFISLVQPSLKPAAELSIWTSHRVIKNRRQKKMHMT